MQGPSTRASKIIFATLAVGGLAVITKLAYGFLKNRRSGALKIKTVLVDGRKIVARDDLIRIIQRIREVSQEQVSGTIVRYRALRRQSIDNMYEYEELLNKMNAQLETQINVVYNTVLQELGVSQALFERSVEHFNDREIQKLIQEVSVVKKRNEEIKLSRAQLIKVFDFYEKIQKSILDSTDIQAFDSKILKYQIEDKIWQEFGIEINDVDWAKTNYSTDRELMAKMQEISHYMASIQKLNKSLLGDI